MLKRLQGYMAWLAQEKQSDKSIQIAWQQVNRFSLKKHSPACVTGVILL